MKCIHGGKRFDNETQKTVFTCDAGKCEDQCVFKYCNKFKIKQDWNDVRSLAVRIMELTGCDHIAVVGGDNYNKTGVMNGISRK